ncbi:barstar family protein [uncultured Pluralibacter sp.]|uniref:barstar family protein n=1 Tax=uncultured Pluralibacter sp. TaxID=1490864 RepID=UPI0026042696|nr:barstar family protein [uncultured Pluralibacter sp.]
MSKNVLYINGANIHDIASFYTEINRVFMVGETWTLGESLDALDDMLYGGYGVLHNSATAVVIWQQMEKNRTDLGEEETRCWYREKLRQPERFNAALFQRKLIELDSGSGELFFDIVLEIFNSHSNISLRQE